MWHGYIQKYPPKVLSSTFTPSLPFSLSLPTPPLLPPQCVEPPPPPASSPSPGARGHRGRRRPLESEPRRVEDLELGEVLQPVDLEVRIREAQPRAPRRWCWMAVAGWTCERPRLAGLRARRGAPRPVDLRAAAGSDRGRRSATRPAELRAAPRHDRRPVGLSRGGRRRVPWSRSSVSRPPCGPALPPPPSQRPPRSSLGAAAVRRWEPPRQPTPAHSAQGARPSRGGWLRPGARRSGLAPCAGGGARGSSGGELLHGR